MIVLGIDEVGRGSLAGPLVVGAVALDAKIIGLKDSKLLSRKQRLALAEIIKDLAKYIGLGWVNVQEIDKLGLTKSLTLGAKRALENLNTKFDSMILDGSYNYIKDYASCQTLPKADSLVPAVSAASIIAKVARDNYMIELAKEFPMYMFESHVGYGTKSHIKAISEYGACIHHRKTFEPVKSILLI